MKHKKVEQIQNGDVLAEDVLLDGSVLIEKGSILKEDYIVNLKELNIEFVIVEDNNNSDEKSILSSSFVEEQYPIVKNIMERLIHGNEDTLQELVSVAKNIQQEIGNHFQEETVYEVSSRNSDLYMHSIMVCALTCLIGFDQGLKEEAISDIAIGALLHDIGYRFVSTNFENVDINSLSPGEVFEIKKHTIYGFSAIEAQKWIGEKSKMIILSHHERLDGNGYPLKQKNLCDEVKIVCVCDEFDSLISGIGKELCEPNKALEVLRSCGKGFDGEIVKALEKRIAV